MQNNIKFPYCLINWHIIEVTVTHSNKFDISMSVTKLYNYSNMNYVKTPYDAIKIPAFTIGQIIERCKLHTKIKYNFANISKFLLFNINNTDNEAHQPVIYKVYMSLNDQQPISWSCKDETLLTIDIWGKTFYIVSLIPTIKIRKDIKKILRNNINGQGINFSRISKVCIWFDSDTDALCDIDICCINTNFIMIKYGMTGLSYMQ